jgi:hypothetical protein
MTYGRFLGLALLWALLALPASPGAAQQVRINRLTDVGFGTISNFTTDLILTRNICVFSTATGRRYSVTARGSGTANAFTLASGTNRLPYEVQWAQTSAATSGIALTTGVPLTGQVTAATSSGCISAPTRTATLITILRANQTSAATAGSYSGVLTLVIAPN